MLEYREINVLDRNSEHFGVPTIQLMENAGKAAFEVMKERIELKGKNVCILAGKGNNGGDGVVLARLLAKLSRVTLVLPFPMEQGSELSRENYKRLPKKVKVKVSPAMDELAGLMDGSHVIVDALLGIGITSEPREPIAGIVRTLQRVCEEAEAKALVERKTVVSLDVPTGMGTGLAVTPDLTVTFHDSKTGMNQGNSGDIIISSIGIPELAAIYTGPGDFAY